VARLIVAARDDALTAHARALLDEGLRAFPTLNADAAEVVLPTTSLIGRCRICGEVRQLTKEHVPPAAAFNQQTATVHTAEEWLARGDDGELPGGELQDGGIWGYTLCEGCNNATGVRYGEEYKLWAVSIINAFADAKVNVRDLEAQAEIPEGPISLSGTPGPRPGAFLRQALAIMCTLSADFDLAGRYPAIRRLILDRSVEPLPEGMSLGLTGYIGGYPRVHGPQLVANPDEDSWHCVMELAVPPLALLMVLGGNRPYRHVFDLSAYALVTPKERRTVSGRLAVAIGYTIYPGDYRTKAMLEAQRAAAEAAALD
jgi:hypothetical protein